MEQPKPEAATPASTGGAGTSFEQHVDTAFLALLLVKGIPPCIIDTRIEEVHFQTRHLGWYTDDILIIGRCGDGSTRRLAAQVKRTFRISSIDEDCVSTIDGAWKDFQSSTRFDKFKDAIAIITQRGSERLLAHFGTLLDLARASLDADDFLRRIGLQGFINKIARNYNQEIRKIIESKNGVPIVDNDYWEFLKSLHILNLDLNSPTSQVEAWIKTLLAHTASDSNNLDVARATWNELLSLASRADPIAESLTYDKLPEDLRRLHSPIGRPEHSAIKTLGEHSELVLTRISSIIGPAIHIPRDALCTNLQECLELNQVIIVTGPAGSGKSAIAKDVIGKLSQEYMVFAFRAEEFAAPHLDETIHRCQIVISSHALFSLFALHSKKLILIESTERLLEKSEREAFAHLLQLIRDDDGWRIILTCRDYSLDIIRTSFLEYAGLPYSVVNVPLLNDIELNQAIAEIPKLKRPNENPALHKLFLNPYILDKAVRMDWPENAKLPQDERSFRSKVWKEIIREDDKTASGMPMRREEVFLHIALRRAQSLDQYAKCGDLDKQALDHLRNSNLIEFSEKTENLAAPAHDVLEDWALIQFLEQRFAMHGLNYSSFLAELGTHPALRRAYRKWLGEMLECEPQAVDNYVLTVISDGNLTQQSRDDTLVSVMLSSNAAGFISRNDMMLLQENASLLRRMIHLLRVACRTFPNWLPSKDTSLALLVPKGPAWAAILKCTHQNLVIFTDNDLALLAGLLEDWSQGVNFWLSPYPEGAEDAATIAFELLKKTEDWSLRDFQKDLLKIIAKIPKASSDQFEELVERAINNGRNDSAAEEISELLLRHLDASATCRDFPELIIKLANAKWIVKANPDELARLYPYRGYEIVDIFGLDHHIDFDFFPPSAYHGPFLVILRTHPRAGLDFIIQLLNHCVSCYANPYGIKDYLERPWKITLELSNGSKVEQWCSDRLWCLYRSSSSGPHVLQSALMALESWLLELCQQNLAILDRILIDLLTRSNNVAVTSVVVSVAIAHTILAGQAAISLLKCPVFFELDRIRMMRDYSPSSKFLADWPIINAEHGIYNEERKNADALKHRKLNLENLAITLQLSSFQNQVQEILDHYYEILPQINLQTNEDRIWRIALHRMDLRHYDIVKAARDGYLQFQPKPVDPDIQEFLAEDNPALEASLNRSALLFWAMSVFKREKDSKPDEWQQRLLQAQQIFLELGTIPHPIEKKMAEGGIAYSATVSVRDHWLELSEEDRNWCVEVILNSVSQDADNQDDSVVSSRDSMDASRPCAFILPLLLSHTFPYEIKTELHEGLAISLTHASQEVAGYAAEGIGTYLWQIDRELSLTCVELIIREAKLKRQIDLRENAKPYSQQLSQESRKKEMIEDLRSIILKRKSFNERDLFTLDLSERWGQTALWRLIPIFSQRPQEELSRRFFKLVADALVKWWDEDKHAKQRDDWLDYFCIQRLTRFAFSLEPSEACQICEQIINVVDTRPKEVTDFIEWLIISEDTIGNERVFWCLWETIAKRVSDMQWSEHFNKGDSDRIKLLNTIFLGLAIWKEDIRHWKRLEGNNWHLDKFFELLAPNPAVLGAYCRFLYQIGEVSMPNAFVLISKKLSQSDNKYMFSYKNTVFYLEALLRRYVYGHPGLIKSDTLIRDSVLHLLDELVERGSSAAYRMRDDFVTPLSSKV